MKFYNARQHARERLVEHIQANLPECFDCRVKMFITTENRFFKTVKCPICGKKFTIRKRG